MAQCCGQGAPPRVVPLDQYPGVPLKTSPLCSLPPLPASLSLSDLKGVLIELRNECASATIHQEQFFTHMLRRQAAFQEEMRSTATAQVFALKTLQDEILAEFKQISMGSAIGCEPNLQTKGNGSFKEHTFDAQELKVDTTVVAISSGPSSSSQSPVSPSQSKHSHGSAVKKPSFSFVEAAPEVDFGDQSMRARAKRMLTSREFEIAIAASIMANAVVMFWEGQYQGLDVGYRIDYPGRPKEAEVVWANAQRTFDIAEWAFGLLFTVEALSKISLWMLDYFWNRWNLLDFFCVGTFVFDRIASGSVGFNPQMLRLLRLFRLVRLVRLLRFLENLDHLYVMTTTISGLGRVLVWAAVLLTTVLLACDLLLVQILQATYFSNVQAGDLTDDQLKKHHAMYEYFGTCTRCMLSMFEITLGNWPPVARLLSEECSEWFTLVCLIHKLTVGFAVISVINGVILQETFKVAQTDDMIMLRQKKRTTGIMRQKMEALFESLDVDGDGSLEKPEFEAMADDPNIRLWLASLDIESDDLGTLFELCDDDNSGHVTAEEICARMPRIRGAARSIDLLALKEQMKQLNTQNGNGHK